MKEPSVLDFVKSRLMPWKYPRIEIPEALLDIPERAIEEAPVGGTVQTAASPASFIQEAIQAGVEMPARQEKSPTRIRLPWRSLLALALALAGQFSLRPAPERAWAMGVFFLLWAAVTIAWAYLSKEWSLCFGTETEDEHRTAAEVNFTLRVAPLVIGTTLAIIAFITFGGLEFSLLNLGLLLAALFFIARALWKQPHPSEATAPFSWIAGLWARLKGPFKLQLAWSSLFAVAGIAWVIFFRYFRLGSVPPEMNSDHAEKILDVLRVLSGQTLIFFPTNGGREALQFYLVAGLHKYLGIPLGFDILKLVTITVGFLALPFIYLIGKEIAGRRVAFLAFLFAGIAYWPNVVSRAAMRLPFYMLFTAAVLYFLIRGIRRSQQRDFIWAGAALGLSLYGYSADRILPLVVLLALGLYLLHGQSRGHRRFTLIAAAALIFISIVVFLPLLRYILAEPEAFLFRTLTRMSDLEKPLDQLPWMIFLNNLGRALAMFSWNDGEVWVISIPGNPALGIVAGGLFYLGVVILFIRYLRRREWLDLFWLLSIPALMLPSILSLAFPHENPNLYRTGGAIVPVFLMIAIALDRLMQALIAGVSGRGGVRLAWGLALLLFAWSSLQDYDLVFNRYFQQYQMSAWNTSEIGQIARDFINSIGSSDTVWVVGHAHWVDTRLAAISAGYPGRDFQIMPDQLENTLTETRAKLFFLHPEDIETLAKLNLLYPNGWQQPHISKTPTKDFILFIVPPKK